MKNRVSLVLGSILLAVMTLGALLIPWISGAEKIDLLASNQSPSITHWFGTDPLGRDLFILSWKGARLSMFVGLSVAFIDLLLGTIYGATAGWLGGWIKNSMMQLIDALSSLPTILLTILLMVYGGKNITTLILALALPGWLKIARIVCQEVYQLKQADFVKASVQMGGSATHILQQHIFPHCSSTILVAFLVSIPQAILAESLLSFLGLGIQPPQTSWGLLIKEGSAAMDYYPWRTLFPALEIILCGWSVNLIADHLDPQYHLGERARRSL